MNKSVAKFIVVGLASIVLLTFIVSSNAKVSPYNHAENIDDYDPLVVVDTPITPITLHYNFDDQSTGDPLNYPNGGGLMLNNPSNIHTNVEYDPVTGQYITTQTMGGINYRPPTYLESEEYQDYMFKKQVKGYWSARAHADSKNAANGSKIPKLQVGGEIFDRIFGGNTVDIRPNGSAELIFAYNATKTDNPALPVKQRKIHTFDFNEKIQLNVIGKIGDKLKLTASYNTESTFDYENQMKLEYTGYEDEIIKKIEAGNVSMPLSGSLITGSQTLFGVKTQLQFGRLTVTSILSQQKGKKSEVESAGGAQVTKYEIAGDNYEANKHFFLAQYFRDHYNEALAGLPFINSQINITRMEVWVSNTNNVVQDIRSVVGFSELGESAAHIPASQTYVHPYPQNLPNGNAGIPDNRQNDLYQNLTHLGLYPANRFDPTDSTLRVINYTVSGINSKFNHTLQQSAQFELLNAKKLQPSEYTFNPKLGFISLNQQLNPDQVLCVAYEYTYNGQVYHVGDFSENAFAPKALFVKLLKSTTTNTRAPLWNLMMKNVYSIGSYQINAADFKLDVFYTNSKTGTDINYLPVSNCQTNVVSKPLIQVLSFDKLNSQNDQTPDGQYDFIDGVTINANTGRIIFPVVQPFGDYLQSRFSASCDPFEAGKYVFHQLYDSTRVQAQQIPSLNRFKIKGSYKSAGGSEISLGAPNVPQGSVTVTAGGVKLTENVDYTVDYTLGRVKVINEGILNSGAPIKVSLESNSLFAVQQKTLMGTHLDFKINKDFSIGGTIMNLKERPLTKKVNIGDEPINNTIWGLDGNYRTDAPFLTRLIDKLPFLSTKEMSTITASAEYAYLIPGHNKAIGKNGNAYIDDFEGSTSTIDLRSQGAWNLASTPQGQPILFPETAPTRLDTSVVSGYNRARLAWYVIDPMFLRADGNTPTGITSTVMSNNFVREVPETEVFPNKQSPNGVPVNISTLDMAYYPHERGPYNYDLPNGKPGVSSGLELDGSLKNSDKRWGGAMRAISSNDFEAANIDYIQFWVMDPFNADNPAGSWNTTGNLYFNLGNVSEDILHDNYKSAENALPAPSANVPTISTAWGIVPNTQPLINAFNSDPADRPYQDVGLDGLSNVTETNFFNTYLNQVNNYSAAAYQNILSDPSADDYHYFRGDDYDNAVTLTRERYKKFNGLEGNSAISSGSYPTAASTLPNVEDINHDNNLSTVESYYQYHIGLKPSDFAGGVGTNYITNVLETTGQNIKDGTTKPIKWYQFKIPIRSPELKVGAIENFQSIRFIRMFFKDVDENILLRFARLELVRDEWRKYGFDLLSPGLYIPNDDDLTLFDVGAVNIEENGSKQPVNYVLPPNIDREINAASANLTQLNEQAMSLTVCNLADGKARAAYKNTDLDVRNYHTLKMYIHGEASANTASHLNDNDLDVFVRLGTDYTDNYYEYAIPLQVTPPGSYTNTETDQYKVWPSANEMILEFAKLLDVKQNRNAKLNGSTVTLNTEYSELDGTRTITIKGNPTISEIRTIMIGIRNPKKLAPGGNDDGLSKCAQVWVNELRLTDFDQKGGWAANARITAKLADLGTLSLSGSTYTPGFGSLENKVDQRKRETMRQYDVSSSLELGKFLPKDAGIHIPMYIGRAETWITPKYNPLDPDLELIPQFKEMDKHDKDSLKSIVQDYTKRNSLNFTNVKKDKGKNSKKSHIYDISNFALSYSYTQIFKRNVNVEYNDQKNYRGGLMYSFSPAPKNIKPFAKTAFLQSNYLALIRDINFYLKPSNVGFSTDLIRSFGTAKDRNTTGGDILILPTYNKQFNMNRNYTLKWDLTKALKFDFTANNLARIFEPAGDIDTKEKKDTILTNLMNLGRTSQYNHQVNLNYTIPINKIPYLDFTSASVKYTGTYTWQHSPLYDNKYYTNPISGEVLPVHVDTLGNTIQNSRNIQWSGQLNMTTLYNRVPYFKKINTKGGGKNQQDNKGGGKAQDQNPNDTTKQKKTEPHGLGLVFARLIMSVKTISGTYAMIDGIMLNGYNQSTQMLGMDAHFKAPTTGFILGSQQDIRQLAIDNSQHDEEHRNDDWLVHTSSLNTPYTTTSSRNLNLKANLEPMPDLKIELSATRAQSRATTEFFKWGGASDPQFVHQSPTESGNFSMSFSSYRTSFMNGDDVFGNFLEGRQAVSNKLALDNPYSNSANSVDGYSEGYNSVSQEVLIPAFLDAYSGKFSKNASTSSFPKIPKPNWRVTYDGLSKLKKVKKHFKTVTLSHAYRSNYSVGGYSSNLLFHDEFGGYTHQKDTVSTDPNPNFYSDKLINAVTISEQWSPLIKIEVMMNNSITLNFEYKKDRNVSLGLTSKTVTEVAGREMIFGAGYRIQGLTLGKQLLIKGKPIKADLVLKGDLSFRKNITTIRRIVEGVSQPTGGTNIISIKVSADYQISTTVSIRLFYDHIINKPVISSSFPTTNTNAGISLRLTLSN